VFGSAVAAQLPGGAAAESAVGAGAEEITLQLLDQLIVILVATRHVTAVVRRLGQTDVSGEILAGVLLGPSLLGALFPGFMHALFPVSTGPIFTGLAQVGLIFLMFSSSPPRSPATSGSSRSSAAS
jgi:Sodium/hydrogen exchanger family